jgi:protein-disulfide isomerase
MEGGVIKTPEDLRLKSSIAKIATNADVTIEDLRRLKPNGMAPELGSRTARITIIEFVDYQCSFCAQNSPAVRRVMYEMEDLVHFMIRDYPVIDPTGRSRSVALAANCVLEQGQEKYWRFHDLVFTDISKSSAAEVREHASQSNVDLSEFDTCMEERRYDLKIDNDIDVGKQAGVQGTPTFFVNGAKYQGYLDEKVLTQIINYYLEALPQ